MHKSVVLMCAIMLLVSVAGLLWSVKDQRPRQLRSAESTQVSNFGSDHRQKVSATFPPPAASEKPTENSKPRLLQISVTDTAVLERKWNDWMSARGCNPVENAEGIHEPMNILRQQALNDNLTAMTSLGFRLVYDPSNDGRNEAKQILWQAAIEGSTCALMDYYMWWQRYHDARRIIKRGLNNKPYVHYILRVPPTGAAKQQAIINAYAWDLVWQMRTGIADPPFYSADLERQYGYGLKWTPMERAQACEQAVDLYNQLQSARAAAGYGPFDNSPPPVILGGAKPGVGSGCTSWPVPKPQCQQAELHAIDRSGVIHPFHAWVCEPANSAVGD